MVVWFDNYCNFATISNFCSICALLLLMIFTAGYLLDIDRVAILTDYAGHIGIVVVASSLGKINCLRKAFCTIRPQIHFPCLLSSKISDQILVYDYKDHNIDMSLYIMASRIVLKRLEWQISCILFRYGFSAEYMKQYRPVLLLMFCFKPRTIISYNPFRRTCRFKPFTICIMQ